MQALALRLTRSRADAEDIVQDALLAAFRFWPSFDESKGTVFAWLLTITKNTFVNRYRADRRYAEILAKQYVSGDGLEHAASHRQTAGTIGDHALDCGKNAVRALPVYHQPACSVDVLAIDELREALAELPEDHRTLITLVDLEGHEYHEAAEKLGIPVGTVMSRLYRGRKLLAGKVTRPT